MPRLFPVPHQTTQLRPVVFLDIEASSLDQDSWPVEIGCAWISSEGIEVRDTLIRPRPEWPRHAWSDHASALHGLTLGMLDAAGRAAEEVADETDALDRSEIVSTNPGWDGFWLSRLRGPGRTQLAVRALRAVAAERLDGAALDRLALALFRRTAPHRAGADAARMAETWAEATAAPVRRNAMRRAA